MTSIAQSTSISQLSMDEVFDHIPAALVIVDRDGRVARANPAAVLLFGDSLLGEAWLHIIQTHFCLRQDDGYEVSLRNGRRVQVSISALNSMPGQLIQITDLTETRQLQTKLSHMERLSALGRMAATLAHQIRTPLSAALLYAANLKNHQLSVVARGQFHDKLLARLHELEHQVSDVLVFARSGDSQAAAWFSVDGLWPQIQRRIEATVLQHRAYCAFPESLPELQLLGNADAWVNALANLVENALQVGADHVEVRAQPECDQLVIRVQDNGPGISADVQQHIFEPFYTTRQQGTGLGLAVVHAVVQAHQGHISIESAPGRGACFVITVPVAISEGSK